MLSPHTWNCTAARDADRTITIQPSEDVVNHAQVNLQMVSSELPAS